MTQVGDWTSHFSAELAREWNLWADQVQIIQLDLIIWVQSPCLPQTIHSSYSSHWIMTTLLLLCMPLIRSNCISLLQCFPLKEGILYRFQQITPFWVLSCFIWFNRFTWYLIHLFCLIDLNNLLGLFHPWITCFRLIRLNQGLRFHSFIAWVEVGGRRTDFTKGPEKRGYSFVSRQVGLANDMTTRHESSLD